MKSISLDELKKIQLDILKSYIDFCNDNNLIYFLGGGTLLGSIRHKGYIPWDDDIDVMMPRADYEILLNKYNNSHFKILSFKNTDSYYYPFAKIVDLRTKLVEKDLEEINEMGVYIDVFPIDYLPNEKKEISKIFKKYDKYGKIVLFSKYVDLSKTSKNIIKKIIKKLLMPFLKNKNICKNNLKKMNVLGCNEKTDTVACISGRYFEKEIMPASYIDGYIESDFENLKCKIPVGYDSYLTKHYGDYMKLPPKEKQVSNHSNTAYWK